MSENNDNKRTTQTVSWRDAKVKIFKRDASGNATRIMDLREKARAINAFFRDGAFPEGVTPWGFMIAEKSVDAHTTVHPMTLGLYFIDNEGQSSRIYEIGEMSRAVAGVLKNQWPKGVQPWGFILSMDGIVETAEKGTLREKFAPRF